MSRRCATSPSPSSRSAPLPKTKLESPRPHVAVGGKVTFGDQVVELDGWPGMIGHNWGAQHAERWIWLHGVLFEDRPDDWLDIALGRIRIGRALTPWVANGVISLNGERVRIGGLGARVHANEGPSHLDLNLHGHEARLAADGAQQPPPDRRLALRRSGRRRASRRQLLDHRAGSRRYPAPRPCRDAAHGARWCLQAGRARGASNLPIQPFPDP